MKTEEKAATNRRNVALKDKAGMQKIVITFLFMIVGVSEAFSTEQKPDLLILGKDTIYLQSFPLERLNFKIRPFKYGSHSYHTTGCWRGYQAVWTIENKTVTVTNVFYHQ